MIRDDLKEKIENSICCENATGRYYESLARLIKNGRIRKKFQRNGALDRENFIEKYCIPEVIFRLQEEK